MGLKIIKTLEGETEEAELLWSAQISIFEAVSTFEQND